MFKDSEQFPGYRVHDCGRIQSSLRRTGPNGTCVPSDIWRDLKQFMHATGYLLVTLRDANGKTGAKRVHRVVATTFLSNPDNLPMVLHGDGNRTNNRLDNLRWGDAAMNAQDAKRHGTTRRGAPEGFLRLGELNAMASISTDTAVKIFLDRETPHHIIAKKLKVHRSCVGGIRRGDRWRKVLRDRIGHARYDELLLTRPKKRVAR